MSDEEKKQVPNYMLVFYNYNMERACEFFKHDFLYDMILVMEQKGKFKGERLKKELENFKIFKARIIQILKDLAA